jgi:hypothetical protein
MKAPKKVLFKRKRRLLILPGLPLVAQNKLLKNSI